jgi:hypothetical protein
VIERQPAERLPDLGTAGAHRDLGLIEGSADQFGQELGRGRGVLRRFDHGPVAGGERSGQGQECQEHREVPRADDAHHALGHVLDAGPATERPEREVELPSLRLHPLPHVLARVLQRTDARRSLREPGKVARPAAVVGRQCVGDPALVFGQQMDCPIDPVDPGGGRDRQLG